MNQRDSTPDAVTTKCQAKHTIRTPHMYRTHYWSNLRPQVFYRLDGCHAASVSLNELSACVEDQLSLAAHVEEGRLIAHDPLPVNAVALWAIQEAWYATLENSKALGGERADLFRPAYEVSLGWEAKKPVQKIFERLCIFEVHQGCIYPSWHEKPEWVAEWDLDTLRWWRHPRLAAEFVAHAPKMKAELDALVEARMCRHDLALVTNGSREQGPVERRVRALLHLHLVDVVAVLASKLPEGSKRQAATV